ncbi:MAG: hypothetical protein Q9227_002259 [Pyrenula ochraceoflavens]
MSPNTLTNILSLFPSAPKSIPSPIRTHASAPEPDPISPLSPTTIRRRPVSTSPVSPITPAHTSTGFPRRKPTYPPHRINSARHHLRPLTLPSNPISNPVVILLTGSTGNLGTFLLHALLTTAAVSRVICLNRKPNAAERQKNAFKSRGLGTEILHPARTEFLTGDLAKGNLGLEEAIYGRLKEEVTHIIHNAWQGANSERGLAGYQKSVLGVGNLVKFAGEASTSLSLRTKEGNGEGEATLLFVSDAAVVENWGMVLGARETVPEAAVHDWRVAAPAYGQSKLIGENVVREGCKRGMMRGMVCRIGQVAGPVGCKMRGEWNRKEWVPSLIRSSEFLKKIPGNLGAMENVDWVPVDLVGKAITELLLGSREDGQIRKRRMRVHHVVNPKQTSWSQLLPSIRQRLGDDIEVVTLPEWVNALAKSASGNAVDLNKNPAAKLMSLFNDLKERTISFPKAKAPTLETRRTLKRSITLAELDMVSSQWMDTWMRQWGFGNGSQSILKRPSTARLSSKPTFKITNYSPADNTQDDDDMPPPVPPKDYLRVPRRPLENPWRLSLRLSRSPTPEPQEIGTSWGRSTIYELDRSLSKNIKRFTLGGLAELAAIEVQ